MGCYEENEVVMSTQVRSLAEDKNITSVGKQYLVDLRQILSTCEPGVLSASNVKNLLRDSQAHLKANGKEVALQILEIMTGVTPDEPIERSGRDQDVLAKGLSDLSIARGRLARDLVSSRTLGTSGKDTTGPRTWAGRSCCTLCERLQQSC